MRNKFQVLTIALGIAMALFVAQVLVGQAPAQGGVAAPGGGGRGGGAAAPGQGGAPGGGRGGAGGGAGGGGRGGGAPAAPAGPVVRTADGKPDFTGYWMSATKTDINNGRGGILNPETNDATGKIPYKPEWQAKADEEKKSHMFNE